MTKDFVFSEPDARALVRLVEQTFALEGPVSRKKHFFMNGLCRLIDAQSWAWGHAVELVPGKLPVYVAFIHGGFSEPQLSGFLKMLTHPDMVRLAAPLCRELEGRTEPLTRTLQQIVPIDEFVRTKAAEEWRTCGIYPRLFFFHPLKNGTFSNVRIYRACGQGIFTDREARIAHIALSEVPRLHATGGLTGERTAKVRKLRVRQRLALELLLQGYSRKAIADTMDISINTVAGYARDIYRFFGVASHAELTYRFFPG